MTGLEDDYLVMKVLRRFFAVGRGVFYVFFIIGIILWLVARHTVVALVIKFLKCICMKCCGKDEKEAENAFAAEVVNEDEVKSNDYYRDLELHYLAEILAKAENELEEFERVSANSV